jgi:exonuclease SbcC
LNFESHKDSFFEFHPGLNVIIGKSDCGKSSVLRALQWVICNEPSGDDFIRVDQQQIDLLRMGKKPPKILCSVELELSNGYKIERGKTRGSGGVNRYTLTSPDGKIIEFNSFGTEVPKEVKEVLGLSQITVGNQKLNLNYVPQLQTPIALEFQGTNLSSLLNRLNGVEDFEEVLKQLNKKVHPRGELGTAEKLISARISKISDDLEKTKDYQPFIKALENRIIPQLEQIKEEEDKIRGAELLFDRAKKIREKELAIKSQLDKYKGYLALLPEVLEASSLSEELRQAEEMIENYRSIMVKRKNIMIKIEELSKISKIDISGVGDEIRYLSSGNKLLSKAINIQTKISQYKEALKTAKDELDKTKSRYYQFINKSLNEINMCPMCQQVLDATALEAVLVYIEKELQEKSND